MWAVEPVLRRVIAARVADRSAVDDLVQDALERLLKARGRLDQEMMVPYGVVRAGNLAASYGRAAARRFALAARIVEVSGPDGPDEVVLREEERAAVAVAQSIGPFFLHHRPLLVEDDLAIIVGDLRTALCRMAES